MIEKLKKQLFDSPTLLAASLGIILLIIFVIAAAINPYLYILVAVGLLVSLGYLIVLRNHFLKNDAETELSIQHLQENANIVRAEMLQEEIAIEALKEKIIDSAQLKELTEKISMCLYLDDTSKTLSAEVNRLFGDQDTTIILYLFHSNTGELGISSSQKGQMRINIRSKKGDIFDQWIVKTMQPLLIEDTNSDYRFDIEKIQEDESRPIRSLISSPLMVGNKALGILRVDSPKEKHFNTEDLRFLTTMGDLGAVAIENAQLYERVEQLAIKDGLTGLYLRRYLLDRIPEEISRQLRRKSQLSFLMIDLDKFKQYNDKFGHVAGDIVLRTIGMILSDIFKEPGNLVCRYGGEEFSVLLPDCPKHKALELAEQVRSRVSGQSILLRREKTHITVSIGLATFPKDAQTQNELIHVADQALYKAKNGGRNQVCS